MKLNHITIQTEAFEKEIEFYQKYVGLTVSRDLRPLGKNIVFLSGTTDDTALEIIEKPGATYYKNSDWRNPFRVFLLFILYIQIN